MIRVIPQETRLIRKMALAPLEDQRSVRLENAEALLEPCTDHFAPVAGQRAIPLILPPLHGHPDKRFNIATRGETDEQEEVRDEGRTEAVQP